MNTTVLSHEVDKRLAEGLDARNPCAVRYECFERWVELGGREEILQCVSGMNGLGLKNEVTQEIAADAIYKAYRSVLKGKFTYQDVTFTAYVKTIARNLVRTEAKRGKGIISLDDESLERICVGEDEMEEETPVLEEILKSVKPKDRDILMGVKADLSYPEIAKRAGISESAARKRKSRAVDRLRAQYHK